MSEKKTKKPFDWSKFWEIFWLCLFGLFSVGGIVFGALGVYCNNVQWVTKDALYNSQKSFAAWLNWPFLGLVDYRIFGVILLAIGAIGILIDMYYYANKHEKDQLVKSRKEERLKALMADDSILLKTTVKDVEPVKETEQAQAK